MNPVCNLTHYFFKIHFNNILFYIEFCLCLGLLSDLFGLGFVAKILFAFLIPPKHATSFLIWS
jgi:hypothetical protein